MGNYEYLCRKKIRHNIFVDVDIVVQALKSFLSDYVVALAVLIIAACWAIWYFASRYQAMKDKVGNVDTLPCSHHDLRLNAHDSKISESNALIGEVKGQIDLLVKLATTTRTKPFVSAEIDYSEKHSPRKLNENGKKLFSDISGETFLEDNYSKFADEITKLSPKTALDVENFALAVLRASLNLDIFIPLKHWVYNEPTRIIERPNGEMVTADVSMDDVLFVLSLPLRDKYLENHSEII